MKLNNFVFHMGLKIYNVVDWHCCSISVKLCIVHIIRRYLVKRVRGQTDLGYWLREDILRQKESIGLLKKIWLVFP